MKASHQTLGQRAFHVLGTAVAEGRYREHQRLSDRGIADELGISRTPVREALQRLTHVGLIDMQPSRFTIVTPLSAERSVAAVDFADHLASLAVTEAMASSSDYQLQGLAARAQTIADSFPDLVEVADARTALVEHAARSTGNSVLIDQVHEFQYTATRWMLSHGNSAQHRAELQSIYTALPSAVLSRDADAVSRTLKWRI